LGAPDARRSSGSGHAIANVLGAGVQLYGDCLDSAPHGLVTVPVDASRVVSRGRLVVIEKKSARSGGLCSPCRQSADALWKHLTRMTFGP